MKRRSLKERFFDKIELFGLLFFLGGLFLFDVNLNNIGAYGIDTTSKVIGGSVISTAAMVWFGFIVALLGYCVTVIRSFYKRQDKLTYFDAVFGIIGTIGLMITLAAGLLLFWHDNSLVIPGINITRISFYHLGIGLDLLALVYFAATK
jgi:hypothetical protein